MEYSDKKKKHSVLTPIRILILSYAVLILFGALLLSLPIARMDGRFFNFINSLFNATSALCVTGLAIGDFGADYTLFGHIVIMLLVQIGGLGFMTITTMMFVIIGKRISLKDRLLISETLNETSLGGLLRLIQKIVLMTLIIEAGGAILMLFVFVPDYGFKGIFYAVFHSISSFCNAGIEILPVGESLSAYSSNVFFTLTVVLLVVLGSLGYVVIFDMLKKKKWAKFETNTKIAMLVTFGMIIFSTTAYTVIESVNPSVYEGKSFFENLLSSFFMASATRTSGFAVIEPESLKSGTQMLLIFNMFVGGNPASTAGGIKTTTAFLVLLHLIATLKGRKDIAFDKHSVSAISINRAVAIFFITVALIFTSVLFLTVFESDVPLDGIMFDTVAALSTGGLSSGAVSHYSFFGKVLYILLMFTGRIGVLTMGMFFMNKHTVEPELKYSEAKLNIG